MCFVNFDRKLVPDTLDLKIFWGKKLKIQLSQLNTFFVKLISRKNEFLFGKIKFFREIDFTEK